MIPVYSSLTSFPAMPRAITRALWKANAMRPIMPATAAKSFFIASPPPLGAPPAPAVVITALAVQTAAGLTVLALLLDLRLRRRGVEPRTIRRRYRLRRHARRAVLPIILLERICHRHALLWR